MNSYKGKKSGVEKTIRDILSDRFKISADKIKDSSVLKTDLGLNSFDAVELVFELKDKLGFEAPQDDYQKINTFGALVEYYTKNSGGI